MGFFGGMVGFSFVSSRIVLASEIGTRLSHNLTLKSLGLY